MDNFSTQLSGVEKKIGEQAAILSSFYKAPNDNNNLDIVKAQKKCYKLLDDRETLHEEQR